MTFIKHFKDTEVMPNNSSNFTGFSLVIDIKELHGVEVTIDKSCTNPTPFGKKYCAKGAYRNKNKIIVVGKIGEQENTIRLSYDANKVRLKFY